MRNVSAMLEFQDVASPLGGLFGAIAAALLQDRAGRCFCLAFAAFLLAAAVAVAYVSNVPDGIDARRAVFLTAKLVQGLAVHMITGTTQTYMFEILPPVLRGPMLAFFPIFILLVAILCIASGGAAVLPESPTYLIRKDRISAVRKSQRRLDSGPMESHYQSEQLRSFIEKEDQDAASKATGYRDCFTGVVRRRTMIVMFASLIPSLFALPFLSKTSYILQIVGMRHQESFLFSQAGIGLGLAANLVSMQTLSNYGRVPLVIVRLSVPTLAWMSIRAAGCFPGTISACVVFNLILPYIFNPDEGALHGKTGFVCVGFSAIALVGTWLYLSEMKDRTPSEIDEMFEAAVPARQFRKWSPLLADPLSSDRSPQVRLANACDQSTGASGGNEICSYRAVPG
ncbi:hypothetical protein BDQ94DRAFT_170451 [Aspergillus welwitschiae]|uniref:General substrate transporter n=1 Tax=Aspergillus welwitschiae TaxID=1341132 RepID=A0A3F3Q3M8_9EURO|nr:hypothetical protein BDQ94DRAFT_170451 [Aspergillus welwitschiae]RDH33286.1 hypothetical protein BDQ94DRAFT_170451 [Aspergillus welwitschiae]